MDIQDETQAVAGPPGGIPAPSGGLPATVEDDDQTRFHDEPPRPAAQPTLDAPGFEIGPEIGRGGMGVVYRARDLAMNREVAVKVLLDVYRPDSTIAERFIAEAQITGQLQHPGIPAVYHVGRRADGRPFLAMKLIKGRTLDAILKSGAVLNVPAVFEALAQAVGFAHAHGVIHRDLKPANVMVGSFGEVQVMDWGLAKVLPDAAGDGSGAGSAMPATDPEMTAGPTAIRDPRDSDGSFTVAGSVIGTPAYMSPEQAAGEVDKVDRRADVFGLGAILCALLTGKAPFTGKDSESVRLAAVRGETDKAFDRLDASGAEPEVVDLCKRCLSFDPLDRPADGSAVAAAIAGLRAEADDRARQAELACARAEVQVGEQRKRRRIVMAAAAGVGAVLLLGIAGTTAGLIRADRARRDAEIARTQAESSLAETKTVLEFVETKIFAAARPKGQAGGLGPEVTLRQAITAAAPGVEQGFRDKPLIEARLRHTLGVSYRYLGDPEAARAMHQRACELFEAGLGPNHPDALRSTNTLANTYIDLGRYAEALALHEQTLARRKAVLGARHVDTIKSMTNLGVCLAWLGRHAEALALREETLAAARSALGPDDAETPKAMANLAVTYAALGRLDESLALRKESLALFTAQLGPDHPDTIRITGGLAKIYADLGRHDEALPLREQTHAMFLAKVGPDHVDTLRSMSELAASLAAVGRGAEAMTLREETLARRKAKLGPGHPDTLESMSSLADSLIQANRGPEAAALLDACLRLCAGKAIDPRVPRAAATLRLQYFRKLGDLAGCRDTAALWESLGRTDATSLYDLACMRAVAAEPEKAVAALRKAVAAGFKDRDKIEQNKDLDPLRSRPDFRTLIDAIPRTSSAAAGKPGAR